MDFLDSLFGGLGELGDKYISYEQARNGAYQGQAYPEQYQPQPENPQTPASSTAVAASTSLFGLSEQTVLIGGGVLLVTVLVLALRK